MYSKSSFLLLPNELLLNVLKNMDLLDIICLSLTCKTLFRTFDNCLCRSILLFRNKYITISPGQTWKSVLYRHANRFPRGDLKLEKILFRTNKSFKSRTNQMPINQLPHSPIKLLTTTLNDSIRCLGGFTISSQDKNKKQNVIVMNIRNQEISSEEQELYQLCMNLDTGDIKVLQNANSVFYEPPVCHLNLLYNQKISDGNIYVPSFDFSRYWNFDSTFMRIPPDCSFGNVYYCIAYEHFLCAFDHATNGERSRLIWKTDLFKYILYTRRPYGAGAATHIVANEEIIFVFLYIENCRHLLLVDKLTGNIFGSQRYAFLPKSNFILSSTSTELILLFSGSTNEHAPSLWVLSIKHILETCELLTLNTQGFLTRSCMAISGINNHPLALTSEDFTILRFQDDEVDGKYISFSPDERYIFITLKLGYGMIIYDTYTFIANHCFQNSLHCDVGFLDSNLNMYTFQKEYCIRLLKRALENDSFNMFDIKDVFRIPIEL